MWPARSIGFGRPPILLRLCPLNLSVLDETECFVCAKLSCLPSAEPNVANGLDSAPTLIARRMEYSLPTQRIGVENYGRETAKRWAGVANPGPNIVFMRNCRPYYGSKLNVADGLV